MSKLDDILAELDGAGTYNVSKQKQQIKDLMLELADQVELETNITTGIPDAIALLRQKVNEL